MRLSPDHSCSSQLRWGQPTRCEGWGRRARRLFLPRTEGLPTGHNGLELLQILACWGSPEFPLLGPTPFLPSQPEAELKQPPKAPSSLTAS